MRVTNQLQNQMLTVSISKNQSAVYKLQQQISSGNRMEVASDDPQSWATAARLHRFDSDLSLYETNATQMDSRLSSMDLSLQSMGDILQSASELAVRGSQGTMNLSDRTILGEQADQYLEELVAQSNTKFDGKYIFGGIQSSTESFTVTRDADGRIDSVSYAGSEDVAEVDVGNGESMGLQMAGGGNNGVLISDETNAFDALITMRDRLLNGENLTETDSQQLVDDAFGQILVGRTVAGAQMERLTVLSSFRDQQMVQVQEQISDVESVDVAEAVTELSAKNIAYEAALAMSSKVMDISLLNYL